MHKSRRVVWSPHEKEQFAVVGGDIKLYRVSDEVRTIPLHVVFGGGLCVFECHGPFLVRSALLLV